MRFNLLIINGYQPTLPLRLRKERKNMSVLPPQQWRKKKVGGIVYVRGSDVSDTLSAIKVDEANNISLLQAIMDVFNNGGVSQITSSSPQPNQPPQQPQYQQPYNQSQQLPSQQSQQPMSIEAYLELIRQVREVVDSAAQKTTANVESNLSHVSSSLNDIHARIDRTSDSIEKTRAEFNKTIQKEIINLLASDKHIEDIFEQNSTSIEKKLTTLLEGNSSVGRKIEEVLSRNTSRVEDLLDRSAGELSRTKQDLIRIIKDEAQDTKQTTERSSLSIENKALKTVDEIADIAKKSALEITESAKKSALEIIEKSEKALENVSENAAIGTAMKKVMDYAEKIQLETKAEIEDLKLQAEKNAYEVKINAEKEALSIISSAKEDALDIILGAHEEANTIVDKIRHSLLEKGVIPSEQIFEEDTKNKEKNSNNKVHILSRANQS